jgi:predicted membrane chloride channel (bestrophin family)
VFSFYRIPVSMLLGFFFLGIEELAVQLEEPFSVLPLAKIAGGIGLSAEEHVQWMENTIQKNNSLGSLAPPPPAPTKYIRSCMEGP